MLTHEEKEQSQPTLALSRVKRIVSFLTEEGTLQRGEVITARRTAKEGQGKIEVTVQLSDGTTKTLPSSQVTYQGVTNLSGDQQDLTPEHKIEATLKELNELMKVDKIFDRRNRNARLDSCDRVQHKKQLEEFSHWSKWVAEVHDDARRFAREFPSHIPFIPSNPLNKDLIVLWEYAQRELIGEVLLLLRKSKRATQDRILMAYEEYFLGLVSRYLKWAREKRENGSTWTPEHFLIIEEFPRFTIPEQRGGPRSHTLDQAAQNYEYLYACLDQKRGKRFRDSRDKRIKITETLGEFFPNKELLNSRKKREEFEQYLERWEKNTSLKQITLEFAAWITKLTLRKGKVSPQSIERHIPKYRKQCRERRHDPKVVNGLIHLEEWKKIIKSLWLLRLRAKS